MILSRVIVFCLATSLSVTTSVSFLSSGEATEECNVFGYNTVCIFSASNILAAIPDLEDEIPCQSECQDQHGCTHFSWQRNKDGTTKCFLLDSCESAEDCADDCQMSVSGPVSPSLKESCCDEISSMICNFENEIGQNAGVESDQECQTMCRDENLCRYWTRSNNLCLLYSSCDTPETCGDCSSGPAFPPIDSCNKLPETHALVLGGHVRQDPWIRWIELIKPDSSPCEPNIPSLPVSTRNSRSVFYHDKIFYCGGSNPLYQNVPDCHAITLLGKDARRGWEQISFMVKARQKFSMTVVKDAVYAVGGYDGEDRDSVESYKEGGEWKLEPEMKLPTSKVAHCSVSLKNHLVVIGGHRRSPGGNSEPATSEVLSFDVKNMAGGWTTLPSMNTARKYHACDTANYEGQFGIFVTGGMDEAEKVLSSVEFYVASEKQWKVLSSMSYPRAHHSLSIVTTNIMGVDIGVPYAAGSEEPTGNVERLYNENWHDFGWLRGWRYEHASVNIPAGSLTCKPDYKNATLERA